MPALHRVVIVGAGFGGLYAAQSLKRAPVEITVIDKRNFHLFQPLLYQVATGGLSPAEIASPIRAVLKRQKNTRVLMGEVVNVDLAQRLVMLSDSTTLPYDSLIIATGVGHDYFGRDQWELSAPGLKTIEDALEIRRRIFRAFESAEREPDPILRDRWLAFIVVGAGPTGVELAGAIAEIAHTTLRRDFRTINPQHARILLIEGVSRILSSYPDSLSRKALRSLGRLGVTVITDTFVTGLDGDGVTVRKAETTERISARTILWAAGIKASPLGRIIAGDNSRLLDRAGRIAVEPDMTVNGHPQLFVIGDLATFTHQTGQSLQGVAPVAMQQGKYVARLIRRRLEGKSLPPFRYHNFGTMATIGRAAAVADFGWLRLAGYPAWLTWLFVHLMYLIEFDNRLLVLVQWAWNYITRNRGARLITNAKWPVG